jgi:arabinofuranosyltransferase
MLRRSQVIPYILPLIIFAVALAARIVPGPRTIDDSYITFRYARNILAGIGFVYNPGEHVLGTTTPFYTLLLTTIGFFTGGIQAPFPQIALYINAIADALSCLLLFKIGRKLGSPKAGFGAALVWAIAPYSVTFAIGGLETSVYILLLTGTIAAHVFERHKLSAFLAALSLLTRPDALILIGPIFLDRAIQILRKTQESRNRKVVTGFIQALPDGEIFSFLAPTTLWFSFAALYFGSPIPHSMAAKSIAYRLAPDSAFIRLLQHYGTPFLGYLTFGIPWIGIGFVLYFFLFLLGARRAIKSSRHIWPWIIYPWLYFAVFAIANPLIFRWYLTPLLPPYIFTILLGADKILTDLFTGKTFKSIGKISTKSSIANGLAILFIIFIPVSLSLRGWSITPDHGLNKPAPDMAWYQLELLYHQAAEIVAPEAHKLDGLSPILAAGDVGVLGYYTNDKILDTVGLNSSLSLKYYPLDPKYYTINYAIPPQLIMDALPDFIVILEVYGREGLLKDPTFWQDYRLVRKIPTEIYGSDGMLIFARKAKS